MLVIITFLSIISLTIAGTPYLTEQYVDELNKKNLSWTASIHGSRFEYATKEQIQAQLGVRQVGKQRLPRRQYHEKDNAPASFESATKWPNCPSITTIRDQSACGSCWAIAAAEAITDRYCTFGVDRTLRVGAANLMECCWYCGNGCNGGEPSAAWSYWVSTGLVSESCQPYPFPKCEHHITGGHYPPCPSQMYPTPKCSTQCNSSAVKPVYHRGKQSYSLLGVNDYMTEIETHGPIEVAFSVYKDFLAYKGGVYVQTSNDYLGGHAVRIVGWGSLNGVDYWKVANSWNADWGMNGYFLIKRGVDECGIEMSGVAGVPKN